MMLIHSKARLNAAGGKRRGAAVAEFAIVSPIMALILMGMIELSRGILVKVALSDAARAGCRAGIQRNKANADITQYCKDVMVYNGFPTFNPGTVGSVYITVTDGKTPPNTVNNNETLDAPSGSYVSVTVSIPVSATTWVPQVFLTQGSLESETIVMMKQ
jgi:Flp pilus assembly protein TadG